MTPLMLALLEVMKLGFVGLVAAYATNRLNAHFTFERFRREEAWKLRRDAYETVIMEFSRMRFNASEIIDTAGTQGLLKPRKMGLPPHIKFTLRDIVAVGDFFVSARTLEAARKVLESNDRFADDEFELANQVYAVVTTNLPIVLEEAIRQLGLPRWEP